jgi:hypothetical protein
MARRTTGGLLAVLVAGFVAAAVARAQEPGAPHCARAACCGPSINRSTAAPIGAPVVVNAVSTGLPDGVVMVFAAPDPPVTIVWVRDAAAAPSATDGGVGSAAGRGEYW